ncbi:MAG: DNA-directed RNA polymerase subunit beta [Candidatus Eisenbacteria bacterium]|nr:DNA-directed RNA polymerase subunit beta [Candidatus Eisenbacteria bacterium]
MPNLLDVQLASFRACLGTGSSEDEPSGLDEIFKKFFPVEGHQGTYTLEYKGFRLGKPKHTIQECRERNLTFEAPLKATLRLVRWEPREGGERKFLEAEEAEIYLGDIPLITERGTFVINGAERVIVSQLHRSPGVFFQEKTHPNGTMLYFAKIIPYRGTWVEVRMGIKDEMFIRTDRRHQFRMTTFLRALGFSKDEDIRSLFYEKESIELPSGRPRSTDPPCGRLAGSSVVDEETGEVVVEVGEELKPKHVKALKSLDYEAFDVLITESARILVKKDEERDAELVGRIAAETYKDPSGEVIVQTHEKLTLKVIDLLRKADIREVELVQIDPTDSKVLDATFSRDKTHSQEDALQEIYKTMKGGNLPSIEAGLELVDRMFFDPNRYDLKNVGRYKINRQLGISDEDVPIDTICLTRRDFVETIKAVLEVVKGEREIDDIDHLGNRRVRSVGELLENQLSAGLSRMVRVIRDRMSTGDGDDLDLSTLVNSRPISAVVRAFFGSNQLSQFMEQTNPLAELTHKRRLSALGPGGLTRERAGFEVRDVHYSHYGRMCPIETPEGPNIGLISSLSTYGRINDFGFIETPYYRVEKGRVTDTIDFLTASEEDKYIIAQAGEPVDRNGRLVEKTLLARHKDDFPQVPREEVEYNDVSPKQLVSAAAALIPFLEHDDANRALMGSNMQRQAVPLIKTETPLVGTGIEERVAIDSGAVKTAKHTGVVERATADRIVIRHSDTLDGSEAVEEYDLRKFQRTNQNTCINQRPVVRTGQKVMPGDVIADGPSTKDGELALGANLLVAFMPWEGYNFEDAILVSERILREDRLTSIHIEEFESQVRETKRGMEEFTPEIPNVSEERLKDLDENGLVRPGARVSAGDILIGKVTPKGETELTPEENLLRAIFGDRAGDVRDTSLKAPPGMKGIVIDTKLFSRRARDERSKKIVQKEIEKIKSEARTQTKRLRRERDRRIYNIIEGRKTVSIRDARTDELMVRAGRKVNEEVMRILRFDRLDWDTGIVKDAEANRKVKALYEEYRERIDAVEPERDRAIERVKLGEDLPRGVVKLAKVYVATKRKLSVGDKLAGRHGNKGVVAKIMAEEDMPYLPDGTPVDIVLNPLGVPSRMNLGQILETHLGWAADKLGYLAATPVFNGATIDSIKNELEKAGLPRSGKTVLYDGRTGQPFEHEVTTGRIYIMKLLHLVDDKIHARSIGPYSLVTQQPLGGKAQFGGQRFGEMEVWALEAYGAAHTLQELLTVKSDDVVGRSRTYEAIVKGQDPPKPGTPASFDVLMRELQSLGLDVTLVKE